MYFARRLIQRHDEVYTLAVSQMIRDKFCGDTSFSLILSHLLKFILTFRHQSRPATNQSQSITHEIVFEVEIKALCGIFFFGIGYARSSGVPSYLFQMKIREKTRKHVGIKTARALQVGSVVDVVRRCTAGVMVMMVIRRRC